MEVCILYPTRDTAKSVHRHGLTRSCTGVVNANTSALLGGNVANNHALQGMQQPINQDVLNLYELLTRVASSQNQQNRALFLQEQSFLPISNDFRPMENIRHEHHVAPPKNLFPCKGQHEVSAVPGMGNTASGTVDPMSALLNQMHPQDPMFLPVPQNHANHSLSHEGGNYPLGDAPPFFGQRSAFSQPGGNPPGGNLPNNEDYSARPRLSTKPPLRALSAYNFFFRDERDRIVNETVGEYDTSADKKQELLERHWYRDRTTKRRHRKTHGKIAFTELSKVISQRWKELPESVKAFYHDVAAEDSHRYNREVEAQKRALQQMA